MFCLKVLAAILETISSNQQYQRRQSPHASRSKYSTSNKRNRAWNVMQINARWLRNDCEEGNK